MFEVGFQEILLIAFLALLVLGPEKLPKLAAQLGRWTGRARSMARNLRQQLEQEVGYDELLKQKEAAEEALRTANSAPMDFHRNLERDVEAAIHPEVKPVTVEQPPAITEANPPSGVIEAIETPAIPNSAAIDSTK